MADRVGNATVRVSESTLVDFEDFAAMRGVSVRQVIDDLGRTYISKPFAKELRQHRQLREKVSAAE